MQISCNILNFLEEDDVFFYSYIIVFKSECLANNLKQLMKSTFVFIAGLSLVVEIFPNKWFYSHLLLLLLHPLLLYQAGDEWLH